MSNRIFAVVVPGLLVAGCAEDLNVGSDGVVEVDAAHHGRDKEPTEPPRPFEAEIFIFAPSCDAPIAEYEAGTRYVDDGTPVPLIQCRWTFDDGTTSDTCAGQHEFETGGFHDFILDVTDLSSGATDRATQRRFIDFPIEADLEVRTPKCGLEISWVATVFPATFVRVFVEPADKILPDDPFYYLNREYTLQVAEPGDYTVILLAEDERPVGPICTERVEKVVTVTACHDHTPTCGHHK